MPTNDRPASTAKKPAHPKSPKSSPKQPSSPKKTAPASQSKAVPNQKAGAGTDADTYTKPDLREKLKEQIKAGEKGGRPGQWSARKAQLLAAEYEKHGGGYKKGGRSDAQKHLQSWTAEKWQTADGKKAARGGTTARYLPKDAWEKLTPAQQKATDEKKKTTSRSGQQFVANTAAAKKARQQSTKS